MCAILQRSSLCETLQIFATGLVKRGGFSALQVDVSMKEVDCAQRWNLRSKTSSNVYLSAIGVSEYLPYGHKLLRAYPGNAHKGLVFPKKYFILADRGLYMRNA